MRPVVTREPISDSERDEVQDFGRGGLQVRRRTCERGAREEHLHLRFCVSDGLCEVCGTLGRLQGDVPLPTTPLSIFIVDDLLVTSLGPPCGVQVESNLL